MFSDPFYTLSKIILCITIVFINFILETDIPIGEQFEVGDID